MTRAVQPPDWTESLLAKASAVQLVVFDVDGVMTDGRLYRDDNGHETKAFHSRDGLGMKGLLDYGFTLAVITARTSRLVEARMAELGISQLMQGRHDKDTALKEIQASTGMTRNRTAYMGDDLVDWAAMTAAGLTLCPADADVGIRAAVDYVTPHRGGRGAVRDACELLLAARGSLDDWRRSFGLNQTGNAASDQSE
ncbi:MAG: HAD hydrolase family protein [Pseudomonadota bacterium]